MVFTVERINDESIVILTVTFPIEDVVQESLDSDAQIAAIGEKIAGRYYRIADMREFNLSFSQIIDWLDTQRYANPGSINDPRIESLLVSSENSTKQAATYAQQEQYGGNNIKIFDSIDEAIAYARANPL